MPKKPQSKLDREIEEILRKKSQEPTNIAEYRRGPQNQAPTKISGRSVLPTAHRWIGILVSFPLGLAMVLAMFAYASRNVSGLLTLIFCTLAVAAIWVPSLLNLRRPTTSRQPQVKYWRGRPYASSAKEIISRSPIDSLKRYFDQRR